MLKFQALIAQIQIGLIWAKKKVTMGNEFIGKTLKDAIIHAWLFDIFLFVLSTANEAENE